VEIDWTPIALTPSALVWASSLDVSCRRLHLRRNYLAISFLVVQSQTKLIHMVSFCSRTSIRGFTDTITRRRRAHVRKNPKGPDPRQTSRPNWPANSRRQSTFIPQCRETRLAIEALVIPGEDVQDCESFLTETMASLEPRGRAAEEIARQFAETMWMARRFVGCQGVLARMGERNAQKPNRGRMASIEESDTACVGIIDSVGEDMNIVIPP